MAIAKNMEGGAGQNQNLVMIIKIAHHKFIIFVRN